MLPFCFRRALEAEAYDYHDSEVSAAEDAYFAFEASRLGGDERGLDGPQEHGVVASLR